MSDPFLGGEPFDLVPLAARSTQEGSVVWALQEKILELRGRINILVASGEAEATVDAMRARLADAMQALRGGYSGALGYLQQYYPAILRDLEQFGPPAATAAGAGASAGAAAAEATAAETVIAAAEATAAETVVAAAEATAAETVIAATTAEVAAGSAAAATTAEVAAGTAAAATTAEVAAGTAAATTAEVTAGTTAGGGILTFLAGLPAIVLVGGVLVLAGAGYVVWRQTRPSSTPGAGQTVTTTAPATASGPSAPPGADLFTCPKTVDGWTLEPEYSGIHDLGRGKYSFSCSYDYGLEFLAAWYEAPATASCPLDGFVNGPSGMGGNVVSATKLALATYRSDSAGYEVHAPSMKQHADELLAVVEARAAPCPAK